MLRAWIVVLVRLIPNRKAAHDHDFALQRRLTDFVPDGYARTVNILPETSFSYSKL